MSQAKRNSELPSKVAQPLGYYRLGRILVLLTLCSLLYATVELLKKTLYSPLAQISTFVLEGEQLVFTQLADIQQMVTLGQPFMQQNVAELQQRIMVFPGLSRVVVRKHWPDRLTIKIQEYQPVAFWNQYQLLDANGVNFRVATDKMPLDKNLVALFGPEGAQQTVLRRYYQIKGVVDSAMSFSGHELQITELTLGENLDWSLKINQQISVLLGREATMQRIDRLIELYPLLLEKHAHQLDTIDLRYESGAAVRLK